MPDRYTTPDELMREIYLAIYATLESRLHLIGSVVDAESRKEILAQQIYDKGDFYGNTGYLVETSPDAMILRVGSNVKHEPFVLGGKVPSWTPIAPLIAWVERKHLSWTDKETGKLLTVAEIAYLIRGKIKREGIAARNVFAEVIANREQWIYQQLNSIEVSL
ncbi:MAG: hypothetical protein WC944_11075 [Candidatus Cloacimonadaceae bacterium]|jgi:hypothetical protein|nr:hypothetical protein [Candidatus Cloacimonadota bacterium]MCB5261046.1 hypothetical protein [Candidatus Cloacimonadota bacterium]